MIKVVVFSTDGEFAVRLREQLQASSDARIVGELSDPEELIATTERLAPDVLIMYLHPKPDPLLLLASHLSRSCQGTRIFAIADSDDPQLILTSMRSGMCEFLTKPINAEQLGTALAHVAALKPPGSSKGKILATVRSTGGCGATFLAVNTACELVSSCEQSVVVVDLDFCGGQVATYLDLMPSFTLGDLTGNFESMDRQMLERIVTKHSSGVGVIARPTPLAQGELLQSPQAHELVAGVISTLSDMYDYIILDGLSPSNQADLEFLRMADNILLVMNLLVPSIRNAHRILEAMTRRYGLGEEGPSSNSGLAESQLGRILLVTNRLGRESSYLRIQDVEKTLGHKIFAQIPDDWRTVSRSINAGDPLEVYAPTSKVRSSLTDMAMRLSAGDVCRENERSSAKGSGTGRGGKRSSQPGVGLLARMFHRAAESNRPGRRNPPRSLAGVRSDGPGKETNR